MRPSSRLAQAVTTASSSAAAATATAALGKGRPKTPPSPPRQENGYHAAMLFMQRHRSFAPGAYLADATAHRIVASPAVRRRRRYEPYSWVLRRYLERGSVDLDALLFHPDAPSPVETLLEVMRHRTPCQRLTVHALEAMFNQVRLTTSAGNASFALQTVSYLLRWRCPQLYDTPAVRVLLCQALLAERLFSDAIEVLEGMPDAWITPGLWAAVMEAAAEGKIPHSPILWRLLTLSPRRTPRAGSVVRTGQRILAEMQGNTAAAESAVPVQHAGEPVEGDYDGGHRNRRHTLKAEAMVTMSTFEVRPTSVRRLAQDAERPVWCHLSMAEVGYAERHYGTLRDERAWGLGTLYPGGGDTASEGIVYGLDARLASRLMLRANVSFSGQASPLIALHILRRYLRTCHVLQKQAGLGGTAGPAAAGTPALATAHANAVVAAGGAAGTAELEGQVHPSPFLLFFKIVRETRDVVAGGGGGGELAVVPGAAPGPAPGGLPMIHWGVVWRFFQTLNRESPAWFTVTPEEAGDLARYVIDALCRGADPWMSLNVARAVSARHIVDGLEMSLWLLHRLDAAHHTEEAREVTRKIFRWLLVDVGVHLLPQLHHHLLPASRVLIRLGLHEELRQFYNAVLDNAYTFSEGFRGDFMRVMEDLVCPTCSSILPERDVYVERACPLCLTVVPAKDPSAVPSFQLSNEHVARLREKRKALRERGRRRLHERINRWSKGGGGGGDGAEGSARPPLDASSVFKRELLGESVPLIPGVSVSESMPLFPFEGGSRGASHSGGAEGSEAPFDVHAAMEESSRRLQLQEAARLYALAQRGVAAAARPLAAPPSLLVSDASHASLLQQSEWQRGQPSRLFVHMRVDGPWTCVWCQEHNSEWSSRVECAACGAETGPSAPWRHFAYAEAGDVMAEIRARVANAGERPVDAVVAAYMLMVYRRAFMLRATPHDHERIDQLIRRLCWLHERVLAGYLYVRFVPPRSRCKNDTLWAVASLFGCSEAEYAAISPQELGHNEEKFFQTIFTPATCKVCFGAHAWKTCPIITRDFSSTARASINMTPEEKQRAMLQHLRRVVAAALRGGTDNSRLVVDAYTTFVKSPYRELFAEVHSEEVNRLSILLSHYHQYRRAAFVLCHVPRHLREDRAYLVMTHYFNVPAEEARELLRKRSAVGVEDESHPNFVQVALTCCMCLDGRHASFDCPRLVQWMGDVDAHSAAPAATAAEAALYNPLLEEQRARRLRAQVDGWTSAGPERLHAFYRFLLQRVDAFQEEVPVDGDDEQDAAVAAAKPRRRIDAADLIVYAVNKTIAKLATVGHENGACRLYARTPVAFVSRYTTCAMLRLQRFSEEGIRTLLNSGTAASSSSPSSASAMEDETALGLSSEAAAAAAVPLQRRCLLCFDAGHAYLECPELAAQPTNAAKLEYVATQVGGIRCSIDGVRGAAAYVYHMYNLGNLTGEMLRAHPSLVRALLRLIRRSFATGQVAAGARVLRRIPTELVPPARVYTDLWRAAGLPEQAVEDRRAQLLAMYEAEGLVPDIDNPPARQTYTNQLVTNLSRTLHDDLCRHCYQHGHTLATCSVFHAEVSFGRDYVAAYRMSMMSEQLDRDWQDAYLLKLADFFLAHRLFMPYHIVGVTNALNAIAAMWSFRGEPGIAMRHLLAIPPAYRRRQAFKHILHALHIPMADINRVLANVYFAPDEVSSSLAAGKRRDDSPALGSGGAVAQHLLMPKPAIRDVAMSAVFNHFPEALAALEKSEERMALIRRRNATQRAMTAPHSIAATVAKAETVKPPPGTAVPTNSAVGAPPSSSTATTLSPTLRVMQSGDILTLREDFDPVLTELEVAVGMKLGSRHVLFTSAVDILAAAASKSEDAERDTPAPSPPSRANASTATERRRGAEARDAAPAQQKSDEAAVVTVFTKEVRQGRAEGKKDEPRGREEERGGRRPFAPPRGQGKDTFVHPPPRQQQGKQPQQQQHYSRRPRYHERQQQQQAAATTQEAK
ncbi:uncharacterized protein Tco025E_02311 [Trypanosoma conorhini]|uniref:Uncharacterized protein n=1 Tax=Trypanosoma conorhini TaxID=83891 RepID=A0A422Q573_9TRYP|nr:uncharacterized protein Tco025E_02311 [Trypanosoma conorhini]RNF25117.1 hypothetical protein Tco025E_02311 [Trypanosoma conorhini]